MPKAGAISMYRRARYGTLLDAHFLDTRQYRTDQPCGDGFEPDCPGTSDPKAQVLGTVQELSLIHISEPRDGATSRMPSSA